MISALCTVLASEFFACRVAPGGHPPGAPTEPDVPNSGIRLLKSPVYCVGTQSGPPPAAGAETAPATDSIGPTEDDPPTSGERAIAAKAHAPRNGSTREPESSP